MSTVGPTSMGTYLLATYGAFGVIGAALFGFGGIAVAAAGVAKILFFVFLVLFGKYVQVFLAVVDRHQRREFDQLELLLLPTHPTYT